MPSINDRADATVPDGFHTVIDAHVHVFPSSIFGAIRKWFEQNAWPIRYRMRTTEIFTFLLSRGLTHIIALQYAHKPGIARRLNQYMTEKCRQFDPRVTGMATVYPGEENAAEILQDGFDAGLGGLKLHAHVQCYDMNAEYMDPLYDCCQRNQKPIIMHAGREPKSTAYNCDPYELCRAQHVERVLKNYPDLKICVPHLGFDEVTAYRELIKKYDTLWLDTTMAITGYFQIEEEIDLGRYRSDRVMYGSDFPNIPYAWDRELKALKSAALSPEALERITHTNAADFFAIVPHADVG